MCVRRCEYTTWWRFGRSECRESMEQQPTVSTILQELFKNVRKEILKYSWLAFYSSKLFTRWQRHLPKMTRWNHYHRFLRWSLYKHIKTARRLLSISLFPNRSMNRHLIIGGKAAQFKLKHEEMEFLTCKVMKHDQVHIKIPFCPTTHALFFNFSSCYSSNHLLIRGIIIQTNVSWDNLRLFIIIGLKQIIQLSYSL